MRQTTLRMTIALVGLGQLALGCDDATTVGLSGRRAPQTSRAHTAVKMPKELWVTSQGSNVIFIRNFENLTPIDQFHLPAGAGPHIITFHTPDFAYVGGMSDGKVYVIDARTRHVAESFQLAPTLVHQVKVSPDGATALVSIIGNPSIDGSRKVTRMSVDEAHRAWSVGPSLDIGAATGRAPVCTVFSADSKRAFVSLLPNGIAVVDVASMRFVSQIPTDGFIACGMIKSDDDHVVIASASSQQAGGHIYTLDMTTATLTDRGVVGARSWHSFIMTPDGKRGFGSSPLSDEVVVFDLTTTPVEKIASLIFDQVPGVGSNQPDAFGGGEPMYGNVLPVGLRASGNVALVNAHNLEVRSVVNLAPPAPFNPMTCGPVAATGLGGCAVHGVTPRPRE